MRMSLFLCPLHGQSQDLQLFLKHMDTFNAIPISFQASSLCIWGEPYFFSSETSSSSFSQYMYCLLFPSIRRKSFSNHSSIPWCKTKLLSRVQYFSTLCLQSESTRAQKNTVFKSSLECPSPTLYLMCLCFSLEIQFHSVRAFLPIFVGFFFENIKN